MKKSQDIERSLLSGALSIEFSDCSIAAADLNHVVSDRMTYAKDSDMSIIGEEGTYATSIANPQNHDNYSYRYREDVPFELDGYHTSLLLGQKLLARKTDISLNGKRRGILRRHVKLEVTASGTEPAGDPFLAVKIGPDALLPIASFARRAGGNCDYVQLGQEMEDDNFFVTTADEYTHRHHLVEAFRAFVKNEELDDGQKRVMQDFIDSQVLTHRAELDQSYEAQLAKLADARLNQDVQVRRLAVMGGGLPTVLNYSYYELIPPLVDTQTGRVIGFGLFRPQETAAAGQTATVAAITRENLALPLLELNPDWETVEPLVKVGQQERARVVRSLLELLALASYRPHLYILGYRSDKKFDKTVSYLHDMGLAEVNKGSYYRMPEVAPDLCRQLDDYFAYPALDRLPTDEVGKEFQEVVQEFYSHRKKFFEGLLQDLGAAKIFEAQLGRAEKQQERFFYFLGRIALRPDGKMGAIFNNMQINNTSGDVKVEAQVTPEDEAYKLVIAGRPRSMTDEPMKPLISTWVNPTSVNPIQNFEKRPLRKADEAEITDILARIYSVRLS